MFQVIDTFVVSHRMAEESVGRGNPLAAGLWAVLAARPGSIDLPGAGETVTVIRTDDSEIRVEVAETDVRHGVAAIRFLAVQPADVPRLSKIRRDERFVRSAAESVEKE